MNEVIIKTDDDGFGLGINSGLNLSYKARILGWERGLFTKDNNNYFNVDRHNPILIQIAKELGNYFLQDGASYEIRKIDSNSYTISVDDVSYTEVVITPKEINWIEIKN